MGKYNLISKYVDFPHISTVEGVKFITDNERALLAYDMGLYKTAVAGLAKDAFESKTGNKIRALVVSPAFLKEHWQRELAKYFKTPQKIVPVYADTIEKDLKRAKDSDFTLINYELLYDLHGEKIQTNRDTVSRLKEIGFDFLIGDEIHISRNPLASRTKAIKELADNVRYLALLSGTPIPNTIDDAFTLVSMLYPDKFPTAEDVDKAYGKDPTVLCWMLSGPGGKMLRRETEDVINLPPITHHIIPVVLNADQERIYTEIYQRKDLNAFRKLMELEKALINPALVDPACINDEGLRKILETVPSAKYDALDKIVERELSKGEKVVIFSSHFRDGVTEVLEDRYKDAGVVRLDGTVSLHRKESEPWSDREKGRIEFQTNPKKRVCIGMVQAMSLGTDLTAAQNGIHLDEPFTDAEYEQANKRLWRPGQIHPVEIFSLVGKYLLNPYGSIDEGIREQREDKKDIITYVMDGGTRRLTSDEKQMTAKPPHLQKSIIKRMSPKEAGRLSPQQKISLHNANLYGIGARQYLEHLKLDGCELGTEIADNYLIGWESSYSGKTAAVYKKIIEGLVQSGENLIEKVDLASGPAILSHVLGAPITSLDINEHQLRKGREFSKQKGASIAASIHQLPLIGEKFDLALCSLGLYYLSLGEERTGAVREANRILKKNGYYILALPESLIDPEIQKKLYEGLGMLGFEVIPELSGFVKAIEPIGSDFRVHMAVGKKIGYPTSEKLDEDQFAFRKDIHVITPRRTKRDIRFAQEAEDNGEVCKKFAFYDPKTGLDEELTARTTDYVNKNIFDKIKMAQNGQEVLALLERYRGIGEIPEYKLNELGWKRATIKTRRKDTSHCIMVKKIGD